MNFKKFSFGTVFVLLVAAMVMCFSPPNVNAASKMKVSGVNQKLINSDNTAALDISTQSLMISVKLLSSTGAVIQMMHSSMTNFNWTKDVAFTDGQLVVDGWYTSNNSAEYVMAWTTSQLTMVNIANYNVATNSWNNNISAWNNSNNNNNNAGGINYFIISTSTIGGPSAVFRWVNSLNNTGANYIQSSINTNRSHLEANWFNSMMNITGGIRVTAITVGNNSTEYQNGSNKGTNAATFKNNDVNYLNGTLVNNLGENNSSSGLTNANYKTKSTMNYRV